MLFVLIWKSFSSINTILFDSQGLYLSTLKLLILLHWIIEIASNDNKEGFQQIILVVLPFGVKTMSLKSDN